MDLGFCLHHAPAAEIIRWVKQNLHQANDAQCNDGLARRSNWDAGRIEPGPTSPQLARV